MARLQDGKVQIWDADDGLDTTIWSLAEDTDGAIWAGTQQNGVARFSGGRWQSFGRAAGLGADCVRVVLADPGGEVWAGTMGGGLVRLAGRPGGRHLHHPRGARPAIPFSASTRTKTACCGSAPWPTGSASCGTAASRRFDRRRGFFADGIGSIAGDDLGNLWFSAKGGVFRTSRRALLDALRRAAPTTPPGSRCAG